MNWQYKLLPRNTKLGLYWVAMGVPDTPQTVTQVSLVGSLARLPSFFSSLSDVHTRSHTNGESSSPLQAAAMVVSRYASQLLLLPLHSNQPV